MAVDETLIPEDEADRLAAVRRDDVLDTPPDRASERITAFAAKHFDAPIAILSIVDSERIWFKSHRAVNDALRALLEGPDVDVSDAAAGLLLRAV